MSYKGKGAGAIQGEYARGTRARRAIDARVEAACLAAGHKHIYVQYSAYSSDDCDVPVDNLDHKPIAGTVILLSEREPWYGGPNSKPYRSKVLDSPTWLEIAVCANEMIDTTGDEHHCFLEGIDWDRKSHDPKVCRFSMGS